MTAKEISDLVINKYWRESIIFLNCLTSIEVDPSNKLKDVKVVVNGVVAAFAPSMFVFSRISRIYLLYDISKPFPSPDIAIPKKKFKFPKSLRENLLDIASMQFFKKTWSFQVIIILST